MRIRSRSAIAFLGVLPALVFLAIFVYFPLSSFLSQGFLRDDVSGGLPRTVEAFKGAQGDDRSALYDALYDDFATISRPDLGSLAREIGNQDSTLQGLVLKTATSAGRVAEEPAEKSAWFLTADPRWGENDIWDALERQTIRFTWSYFQQTAPWSENAAAGTFPFDVFFWRTLVFGFAITAIALIIATPVAYVLANASERTRAVILSVVLASLWTSILARTLSWIIMFQREGALNKVLDAMGLLQQPTELLGTRSAAMIGITHVLLPYMIFALYDGMRKVPASQFSAALSLGASPLRSIALVYIPQLWPAISSGFIIVFTLTVGFYLVPLLLGSPSDQLLPFYIAFFAQQTGNWHVAAALSIWLGVTVAVAGLFVYALPRVGLRLQKAMFT